MHNASTIYSTIWRTLILLSIFELPYPAAAHHKSLISSSFPKKFTIFGKFWLILDIFDAGELWTASNKESINFRNITRQGPSQKLVSRSLNDGSFLPRIVRREQTKDEPWRSYCVSACTLGQLASNWNLPDSSSWSAGCVETFVHWKW